MAEVKLAYCTLGGWMKFQNANLRENQIQEPDGNHPMTPDCVSYDPKGVGQPVITMFQGITPPFGAALAKDQVQNVLYEMTVQKLAFKRQSVNKMWLRALGNFIEWFTTKGFLFLILIAIGGVVIMSLFGG